MKRKTLIIAIIVSIFASMLVGCSDSEDSYSYEDSYYDLDSSYSVEDYKEGIRLLSDFATVECYYHCVAKIDKKAGSGITHIGEKARKYWIVFDSKARLGVDMSKVQVKEHGESIEIVIPKAEVISVDPVNYDGNRIDLEDSDRLINKNKITAEDTTKAVYKAQDKVEKKAKADTKNLDVAQKRAGTLVSNYLNQFTDDYQIVYE